MATDKERPLDHAAPRANRWRRRIRLALAAAAAFHLVLFAVLVAVKNPFWGGRSAASSDAPSPGDASTANMQSLAGKPAANAIDDSPDWKPQMENRIAESIEQADKLTPEEQQDNLEEQVAKLDRISSQESVDEMAKHLKKFLGTQERARRPAAEPVEGEFDYDTAQIHDVQRREAEDGQMQYIQIMLDGEGRTLELELPPAEGERLYEVMRTVKSSPLADTIYRQLVMPTLDNLLKAHREAQKLKKMAPPDPDRPALQNAPAGEAGENAETPASANSRDRAKSPDNADSPKPAESDSGEEAGEG